jgi:hypothetical protein
MQATYKRDGVICIVVLFQNSHRVGHFASFAIFDEGPALMFDSEAILPYPKLFTTLFNNKNIVVNLNDIQGVDSNLCGPMCILYLNFLHATGDEMFLYTTLFEDQHNVKNNDHNVRVCTDLYSKYEPYSL